MSPFCGFLLYSSLIINTVQSKVSVDPMSMRSIFLRNEIDTITSGCEQPPFIVFLREDNESALLAKAWKAKEGLKIYWILQKFNNNIVEPVKNSDSTKTNIPGFEFNKDLSNAWNSFTMRKYKKLSTKWISELPKERVIDGNLYFIALRDNSVFYYIDFSTTGVKSNKYPMIDYLYSMEREINERSKSEKLTNVK